MPRAAASRLQPILEFPSEAKLFHALAEMPKIDLHRHLTGSIDAEIAVRTAARYDVELPSYSARELHEMLFGDQQVRGLKEYFRPWETLNKLFVNKEATRDIILAVAAKAAEDNVIYTELRTSPRGFLGDGGFKFEGFLDAVAESTSEAEARYPVIIRWLLGIPRHVFGRIEEPTRTRMCVAMISRISCLRPKCFVGLDLNGVECAASAALFEPSFAFAHKHGIPITIHAGEMGTAADVGFAVKQLHASRIGHGVAAASDPAVLAELCSRKCALEICPTSNILLRLVSTVGDLPIGLFHENGVPFVICSDNPARCRTSLTEELFNVAKSFYLSTDDVRTLTYRALDHAFADEATKEVVRHKLDAANPKRTTARAVVTA